MARLAWTGFYGVTTAQLSRRTGGTTSGPSVGSAFGMFGPGVRVGGGSFWTFGVPGSASTCVLGVRFRRVAGGECDLINIRNGASTHVYIRANNSGALELRNSSGTIIMTSAPILYNAWYFVEVVLSVISNTVGRAELFVNNVSAGTPTDTDTLGGSTATVDNILFQTPGNSNTFDIDMIYVLDTTGSAPFNARLGDVRVGVATTTADDAVQFTPLSGTNESNIDDGDTPDDDTSYNISSTTGHQDTFSVTGFDGVGTIHEVAVRAMARTTTGGARTFAPVLKNGGTTTEGTALSLTTSYLEASHYFRNNPSTGAPFADAAAVNASKPGYKNVA